MTTPTAATLPAVDVSLRLVRLAATCLPVGEIRHNLNGIRVEPRAEGGAYLVATDGCRLIAIIDASARVEAAVTLGVDRAMAARMPRPQRHVGEARHGVAVERRAKRRSVVVDYDNGYRLQTDVFRGAPALVTTDISGGVQYVKTTGVVVGGEYPDWRRVIPADLQTMTPGVAGAYWPGYVADTMRAFVDGSERMHVTGYQRAPDAVIVFHIRGHEHVLLAVMPRHAGAMGIDVFRANWHGQALTTV